MVNDNYSHVVSRNYTNQNEVSDAGLPKSGFDNSYQSHFTGVIGRLHVASYQHVMPGTKYRGNNSISPTFEQSKTPIMPDFMQREHDFFVADFSVNRDFRDIMTANASNGYNSSLTIGAFSLPSALISLSNYDTYFGQLLTSIRGAHVSSPANVAAIGGIYASSSTFSAFKSNVLSSTTLSNLGAVYLTKTLQDLIDQIKAVMSNMSYPTTVADARTQLLAIAKPYLDFWVGQGSLLDALGYPYVSHNNLKRYIDGSIPSVTSVPSANYAAHFLFYGTETTTPEPLFSDMSLRKYQAIWIAFYRNVQIQPLNGSTYLDYHKWDNSLSLGVVPASPVTFTPWHVMLFVTRVCPWSEDLFTSAQLDDIMRHVYLPTTNSDPDVRYSGSTNVEYPDIIDGNRFMTVQNISYQDAKGQNRSVSLPIPSILNRALSGLNYQDPDDSVAFAFDLFSLKRAQMLERFLKRGHYYGTDEYRDIIKGQYGVDISDLRLNRPHFLGGAISKVGKQQNISQSGQTGIEGSGSFGQRLAIAGGDNSSVSGDTYTDFAEEWGSVFCLYSIIPQVQYDPLCIQNTQIYVTDFPVPVLSQNFETVIPTMALNRSGWYPSQLRDFGHAPSGYQYRSRVNEVHGKFLDEYSTYLATRFFGTTNETSPKLNSTFLECHPILECFVSQVLLDGQFYAFGNHNFYTEAPLAAPVEVI